MTRRAAPLVALSIATFASGLVATPGPATASAPVPTQQAAVTTTLLGPSKARITEPIIAVIEDPQVGDTYLWDLDDNGSFETDTGSDAWAQTAYHRGGTRSVSVRVDGPSGTRVATLDVNVTRPEVAKLVMTPANPGPGQDVTFSVVSRTDRKSPLKAFTWDVEAVKSTRKKIEVRSNQDGKKVPGGLEHVLATEGLGKDVTKGSSITLRMPKQAGRTLDVNVEAITLSGDKIELRRSVTLRSTLTTDPYPANQIIDCANVPAGVPSWPCAAISHGESVADVDTAFVNATPGVEVCYTEPDVATGGQPSITAIVEKTNLGYPTALNFFAAGGFGSTPGVDTREARVASYSLGTKKKCKTMNPITVSWDFGDGTGTQTPSPVVDSTWPYPHRFDSAGTYTVTLVTKVPYLVGEGNSLSSLKYFTATTTTTVEVQESYCGTLFLNGIPLAARHPGATANTPNGCFVPIPGIDGTTLYRPAAGFDLNLNGVHIKGQAPIVNPDAGLITASTGTLVGTLSVFEGAAVGVNRRLIEPTATIVVPPPTYDPTLGDVVSALPAVNFDPTQPGNQVTGLGVETGQLLLSPSHRASERLSLRMPPPLTGQPTIVFGGNGDVLNPSPSARRSVAESAAKKLAADTDFEVNLADTQVGAFYIRSGTIGHRISGGWYGGVVLDVDGLGTLDAPYLPPGSSSASCETADGPSGLELGAGGGFKFAGAILKPNDPIPIGPIGVNCVAVKGAADPFVMVGKAKLSVPSGGPVTVNACLATSVVDKGQTVSGCGNSLTAPMDLVWFRADGTVTLFNALDLAQGYVDTRVGDGYSAIKFGGELDYSISEFGLTSRVDGSAIMQPQFAFDLIGSAELCAILCVDTQAGVSSIGFGACASIGGFVYFWNGDYDLFAFSCDLKEKIGVKQSVRRVQGLPSSVITVPRGQDKVGFEVSAAADSPVLKIIRPDGTVINDTGTTKKGRGYLINHLTDQGIIAVTITDPQAGQWKIQETSEGLAPNVKLFTQMKAPTITGEVRSNGAKRTLEFDASMDVNDEVVFYETSKLGQRRIGVAGFERGDNQSLVIPRAGAAGPRTVTAIVVRNGIPYKKIVVDGYSAPAARQLAAPTDVTLTKDGAGSLITWTAPPDASSFEVTGKFADGRSFVQIVSDPELYVPGVGEFAQGSIQVRSIDPALRSSAATGRTLTAPSRITIVM